MTKQKVKKIKKKKKLSEIDLVEAKRICEILDEGFSRLLPVTDELKRLGICIYISAKDIDDYTSAIFIYEDGRVVVNWVNKKTQASFRPVINAMLVTDYLKSKHYVFKKPDSKIIRIKK